MAKKKDDIMEADGQSVQSEDAAQAETSESQGATNSYLMNCMANGSSTNRINMIFLSETLLWLLRVQHLSGECYLQKINLMRFIKNF